MIRIVVADDHAIVRGGVCRLLSEEPDMEIAGEAEDGRQAVELCRKLKPDVLILDYAMPDMDGLEALRRVADLKLGVRVLILTMYDKHEFALNFIKSGAAGYLPKKVSVAELPVAVRKVAAGEMYFTASTAGPNSAPAERSIEPSSILSDREYQIFIRLARGLTMNETAHELTLGYSTVKTYKNRIMEKLCLEKVSDMTFLALSKGLISKD